MYHIVVLRDYLCYLEPVFSAFPLISVIQNRKHYIPAPIVPSIMSLIDYIRGELVSGKVLDKYKLENGNIGILVEQKGHTNATMWNLRILE